MKTLSRLRINDKQQVKILQALLNIYGCPCTVDGSFGKRTQNAVKAFQKMAGLAVDGSVGRQTWKALRVIEDDKLFILKIPFDKVTAQSISCVNGYRNYKLQDHYRTLGADVVINAGLFTMDSTWRNCQDLVLNGVVDNGGNYSNKGIAFNKGNTLKPVFYQSTTASSKFTKADFIGGSPCLIYDSKRDIDDKGLYKTFLTNPMRRTAIGISNDAFYIFSSFKNVTCYQLLDCGVALGLKTMINLDGGGSQGLILDGNTIIPTDGRGIVSAIGVSMRW